MLSLLPTPQLARPTHVFGHAATLTATAWHRSHSEPVIAVLFCLTNIRRIRHKAFQWSRPCHCKATDSKIGDKVCVAVRIIGNQVWHHVGPIPWL